MDFTALHRALGREATPLTDEMLDDAVRLRVEEADDLDWKSQRPEERDLARSDFAKDVAAMANSGGGLIVYGVIETQRAASERVDVGEVTESYERTLRRVAVSGIQPPVFGISVYKLGEKPSRALAVDVPPSSDGPHLVYRGEYFGAPIRNHADTEWMKERQLESAYQARFEERRGADRRLADLYDDVAGAVGNADRAWMIGVARPRPPRPGMQRLVRDEASEVVREARRIAPTYTDGRGVNPLADIDPYNLRPGLRRWVARSHGAEGKDAWKAARATVHDDGSATLAAAVGGARNKDGHDPAWVVLANRAERFVGDLMALLRATANHRGDGEFDVQIGMEWNGSLPLLIQTSDQFGYPLPELSIPLPRFFPVTATVRTDLGRDPYLAQVWDLAMDVVNQGGVQNLQAVEPPQQ